MFQTFDRFRCAKLVMECLCSFDDASMNRMSVAICGILAAKVRCSFMHESHPVTLRVLVNGL